ncbi:MAG: sugar phosphate nucleotidyltransferase [bacterium]|nr:sugar phosphate nucleotidyltransferase [bacterium]
MKALVLAAAKSAKLSPFSDSRPKTMINLSGQMILERQLRMLKEAGVNEVFLVVGHKREMIQQAFHYGRELGLKIDYLVQEEQKGIGNAVALGAKALAQEERFLLVYGDGLMGGNNFKQLIDRVPLASKPNLATVTHPSSDGAYGNVYLSGEMLISKLVEKPEAGRFSNYIFGGAFILSPKIFDLLAQKGEDMLAVYQELIANAEMEASLWEDSWIDITRPWHILLANQMVMRRWNETIIPESAVIEPNVTLRGAVHLGEGVHIASGTTIVGPCYVGAGSYIGNSCLIRTFSSIGPQCTIGYGTEVKNAVLFGNSVVGRLSFIGDSVLGEHVHLGSGTMTINHRIEGGNITFKPADEAPLDTGLSKLGAFIGDHAVIGTGHNLAPGTWIGSGQILGDQFTFRNE